MSELGFSIAPYGVVASISLIYEELVAEKDSTDTMAHDGVLWNDGRFHKSE